MAQDASKRLGWVLVGIQFALFIAVAVAAMASNAGPRLWDSTPLGLVLVAAGTVGVWLAGAHLGRSLTPHPSPNGEGLAAAGVYRWVRHPMYSALVVICLGVAVASGKVVVFVATALLAVLFEIKTRVEERYLVGAYPGYVDYAARTGKFVPWLARRRP